MKLSVKSFYKIPESDHLKTSLSAAGTIILHNKTKTPYGPFWVVILKYHLDLYKTSFIVYGISVLVDNPSLSHRSS